MNNATLLDVRGLSKHYPVQASGWLKPPQVLKAVDEISFHLDKGETLGLVGESGSGKSTTGRLILRLIEPTAGQVLYRGQSLFDLSPQDFKPFRKDLQMIFQDPAGSLNPAYSVHDLIAEPLRVHNLVSTERERRERVAELMTQVGLDPQMSGRFAHEFSGGQKQRIGIARALAVQAKLIIADEPVSALDVSIQSQILNLMQELKQRLGLAYLFIAHDLAVVKHMSQRVAVMYLGRIVELTTSQNLYRQPAHPYTKMLLAAIPHASAQRRIQSKVTQVQGEIPSPIDRPKGCAFHTRCPYAVTRCREEDPALKEIAVQHVAACHLI